MEALEFSLLTKKLNLVKKSIPKITNPRQILVKVAFAGICGTDIHIIAGEFPCKQDGPLTLGHEFSGIVVDVGSAVKGIKNGDKVAIDPNNGCEVCDFCRLGKPHFCETGGINNTVGIWRNGGWAEYALVPDILVHKLPNNVSLKQGALAEPVSCVAHGWDRISPINIRERILIIGAGIIGNLWAAVLHHHGHRRVTVSEPNPTRRNLFEKLGTDFECISSDVLQEKAKDKDYIFDVIVDCSGSSKAIQSSLSLLNKGGKLCIFGVAPPDAVVSISPFDMFMKEITIYGAIINPLSFPKAMGLLEFMSDRYLDYQKLGVKTFKLNQYQEAMEELKKCSISKAVFEF